MAEDFSETLARALARHLSSLADQTAEPAPVQVRELHRLTGGANQETWSFDLVAGKVTIPCILRRAPGGKTEAERTAAEENHAPLTTEAAVIREVHEGGVPVPDIMTVLDETEDGLGAGYVMKRVEGETIARKILRDSEFDAVRPKLARQCGEILAGIHATPLTGLPPLADHGAAEQIALYRRLYETYDEPHPVLELAFRHLENHCPGETARALVHGDFRNGNLMIGPNGVCAVLDWEGVHLGDPLEDLGWLCVNSWRFGEIDKPVGGFGPREELFAGYEEVSGQAVDPAAVRYWEIFGTLRWGIVTMGMKHKYLTGFDPSMERAAIGRRTSETEIDLLRLLEEA